MSGRRDPLLHGIRTSVPWTSDDAPAAESRGSSADRTPHASSAGSDLRAGVPTRNTPATPGSPTATSCASPPIRGGHTGFRNISSFTTGPALRGGRPAPHGASVCTTGSADTTGVGCGAALAERRDLRLT